MKNIHVLPTDKPSNLFEIDGHFIINREQLIEPKRYLNIYITSDDDKPEKNEWCYDWSVEGRLVRYTELPKNWVDVQKKIILTTDPKLIADGIQSIDDDFLEWFVNNSTCEFLEVEKHCVIGCSHLILNGENSLCCGNKKHKIIIPKEETQQETRVFGTKDDKSFWGDKPIRKGHPDYRETLEEAAENCVLNNFDMRASKSMGEFAEFTFKEGAQWQAERMYSGEEVIEIVEKSRATGLTAEYLLLTEQFKKK